MPATSRPKRIIHVASQLETGGAERLLAEFARHVDRSRYTLEFVCLGAWGPVTEEIEDCGWPVTVLGSRGGVRPSLVYRLARHFEETKADVVHTHNTRPLLYAGPAARLAQVRGVVHTRHGQRHGATRRQDTLFRLAGLCADRVVCVSRDSLRLSGGRSACVIRNGVDTERFSFSGPVPLAPAFFAGRLSREKDVATLIRGVQIAARSCEEFRVRIAGDGPCRAELVALAGALGVADRIEFLGDSRDIPLLLRTSSLLILPSLTEGLPLSVLEAMACGLPVVATSVGGTPEAVEHGVTGLLVPPGDPARLAECALRLFTDVAEARRMGIAGRRRVTELFDIRNMVARYEGLYEEVLEGCGERRVA
jgi:glycosyltransferase involved in cell wall biosynthesis